MISSNRIWIGLAALALAASGCLEIDTKIVLHPNGSGTITERVNFSRKLLDMAASQKAGLQLETLLTRKAALGRMQSMGKGIKLVSHKVGKGPKDSKESVTVFQIPDLANFVYVSPFIPRKDKTPKRALGLKTVIWPTYQDHSSWRYLAGWMCVSFRPVGLPKAPATPKAKPAKPAPGRSPLESQAFRDLRPVFQDLMKGMKIKIVFESYAPVLTTGFGWRDANAGTHKADLINFSADENMDAYGFPFLENEEVMVDLLRLDFGSAWLKNNVKGWQSNRTLPVLHSGGGIFFRPSAHYFQKYFKGKTLKHHFKKPIQATFDKIGWRPAKP
jgi:hypothetical protein